MKFDILKVATAIMQGMHIVEKIKGASGKDKATAVIDSIPEMVEVVEAGLGSDVLNDPAVTSARDNLIASYKAFQNAVDAARHLKGTGAPVS